MRVLLPTRGKRIEWLGQQEIWGRGFSKRPPATAASLVPNADPGTPLPLLSEARGRAQATTFLRSSSGGCDAQLDLKTTGSGPSVFPWADGDSANPVCPPHVPPKAPAHTPSVWDQGTGVGNVPCEGRARPLILGRGGWRGGLCRRRQKRVGLNCSSCVLSFSGHGSARICSSCLSLTPVGAPSCMLSGVASPQALWCRPLS